MHIAPPDGRGVLQPDGLTSWSWYAETEVLLHPYSLLNYLHSLYRRPLLVATVNKGARTHH